MTAGASSLVALCERPARPARLTSHRRRRSERRAVPASPVFIDSTGSNQPAEQLHALHRVITQHAEAPHSLIHAKQVGLLYRP